MRILHCLAQLPMKTGSGVYFDTVSLHGREVMKMRLYTAYRLPLIRIFPVRKPFLSCLIPMSYPFP